MYGFSVDASVTDKDIYNENIISNIANTFTENNESISETNKTKQHNIQEYIHNLISTNTTDNSLETNISRNLELCNETDQTNDLTIGGIKLGGKFNKIEKSQINETTNTIKDEYEQYLEQVQNIVNNALDDKEFQTKVQSAFDNDNFDSAITENLNDTMSKKDTTTDSEATSDTTASFRARSLFNEPYQRNERFCLFACGELSFNYDKEKIRNIVHSDNVSNDTIRNVYELALVNDQEFVNKVSNAYNETKEILTKNNVTVTSVNNEIKRNLTSQHNTMTIDKIETTDTSEGNSLILAQANKSVSELAASSVVKSVTSLSNANDLRAIASDMIGLTADFSNSTTNENESKHNNSIVNEMMNKATATSTSTTSVFGSKKTKIVVACVIGVIIVVAIIAVLITKSIHANQRGKMEIEAKKEISERKLEQGFDVNVNDIGATSEITAKGEARAKEIAATGEAASKVTSAAVKSAVPIP